MNKRNYTQTLILFMGALLTVSTALTFFCDIAHADSVTKAQRMHERLTGVPPSALVRDQMAAFIEANQPMQAAAIALNSPYFYRVVKNWAKPMTNKDDLVLVPLNDMVTTIVGMIRDNKPFDQVLYGDILYTANDALVVAGTVDAYAADNNDHYLDLERLDLQSSITEKVQSSLNGINDTAGILTSRGYGAAFMDAGTNRAVIRWALRNFLCKDLDQLSDITRPDFRVRRDVDRAPGGDSRTFKSQCVGCHAGMDGLAGSTAFFDFTNGQVNESTTVVRKINALVKFANGFVTTNNSWINLWNVGQNSSLGWPATSGGNGLRSLGQLLAGSDEFGRCMAKRVFKQVCVRDAIMDPSKLNTEVSKIQTLANGFKGSGYNMKSLFAATASQCMGD